MRSFTILALENPEIPWEGVPSETTQAGGPKIKPCLRALGVVPPDLFLSVGWGGGEGAATPPEGSAPVAGADLDPESRNSLRNRGFEAPNFLLDNF